MPLLSPSGIDSMMYCWGNMAQGQLGLGGIEEEQITTPRELTALAKCKIKAVASCVDHTLFLMDDGLLYSCGNNDFGQLGHEKTRRKPERIDHLQTQMVKQIACGLSHSVSLNTDGQVFTWGDNRYGQLGRTTPLSTVTDQAVGGQPPKLVKQLSAYVVVQIACGHHHTLALTDDSRIFSWGYNDHGQLGVADSICGTVVTPDTPHCVTSLLGLPIAQISAGGKHSFALTVSGSLFGWGHNRHGQLGVGDEIDHRYPTLCKTLRAHGVKYVCCGEDHSVVLTKEGGVFTFGAGMYGQLGHSSNSSESRPRKVFDLMGNVVSLVACGRRHTLAYVPQSGRLFSFGLGGNGQLGLGTNFNRSQPSDVTALKMMPCMELHCIYAGGDQSFAFLAVSANGLRPRDFRLSLGAEYSILALTPERIELYRSLGENKIAPKELQREIEMLFSSAGCLNGSFLLPDDGHYNCRSANSGISLKAASTLFSEIEGIACANVRNLIVGTIEKKLLPGLTESPPDAEALRLYLTLPFSHFFNDLSNCISVVFPFSRALIKLTKMAAKIIDCWWVEMGITYLLQLIKIYQKVVLHVLTLPQPADEEESYLQRKTSYVCLEVLKKIKQASDTNASIPVPYKAFYISELREKVNFEFDYFVWIHQQAQQQMIFSPVALEELRKLPMNLEGGMQAYCNYPFLFDDLTKTTLLHIDALSQMQTAVDTANRRNMATLFLPVDPVHPCLVLVVHRNSIVYDTLQQITKQQMMDYKKPLRVIFDGEEAQDAGGVRKEFFLLLLREILDPKYGMFRYFEESRLIWFEHLSFEEGTMYELIGVLCGLAIYNGTIININLPLALYKKLLKKPVTLEDLCELQPDVGRSMQQLLDYAGDDVYETFGLYFEVTREAYGTVSNFELVPGGSEKQVIKENKAEFVAAYIDYIFNSSVRGQFEAFNTGFYRVCGHRVLELFQPQELQAMVIGNENYDWEELDRGTEYKQGYSRDHPTIQMFWDVFHRLDIEDKKKFLLFLTGSDRIPILGMSAVKLTIQQVKIDESHLPVAHTCFNLLDLPPYTERETLRRKLMQSIQHTHGFGLA